MLYDIAVYLGLFIGGMIVGVGIVRYGLGLGSKMHVRAQNNIAIDEDIKNIDQNFTQ